MPLLEADEEERPEDEHEQLDLLDELMDFGDWMLSLPLDPSETQ